MSMNRIKSVEILILAMIGFAVLIEYRFLWPVLLFVLLGAVPSKLFRK